VRFPTASPSRLRSRGWRVLRRQHTFLLLLLPQCLNVCENTVQLAGSDAREFLEVGFNVLDVSFEFVIPFVKLLPLLVKLTELGEDAANILFDRKRVDCLMNNGEYMVARTSNSSVFVVTSA
jgi:hypothetical protein